MFHFSPLPSSSAAANERLVLPAHKDPPAHPVHKVPLALKAQPDHKVPPVRKAPPVHPAQR